MADKQKKTLQAEAVERTGSDTAAALEGTPGMFPGDAAAFGARASFASLPSQAVAPQPAPSPSPAPAQPYQGMSAWDDPALARVLGTPVPGVDYDPSGVPEPFLERLADALANKTFLSGYKPIYEWLSSKF